MNQVISEFIKSDAVKKTINPEKQSRHDINSNGYITGRSYLLHGVNAQDLVNKYHGTGWSPLTETGKWKSKETVSIGEIIGVEVDRFTKEETLTDRFTIHYSKTGAHVVPARRRNLDESMDV